MADSKKTPDVLPYSELVADEQGKSVFVRADRLAMAAGIDATGMLAMLKQDDGTVLIAHDGHWYVGYRAEAAKALGIECPETRKRIEPPPAQGNALTMPL